MIAHNRLRELLTYNEATGDFIWKVRKARKINVGDIAGSLDNRELVQIGIDGVLYSKDRLAIFYRTGEWPEKHAGQQLTQEYLKKLLHYDEHTGIFTWKVRKSSKINVGGLAGSLHTRYKIIRINNILYSADNLAHLYQTGVLPLVEVDKNPLNQRKYKTNSSGLRGVSWHKHSQKYVSRINVNGKRIHLGSFDWRCLAYFAYVVAADKHFGAYARYQ